MPLVTRRGKRLIVEASREDLITTDLAIYEACNNLWELSKLSKSISIEDAANGEGLTFCNAPYIIATKAVEAILVTEDEKLQKEVGKSVKTITYTDLENRLIQK